MVAVIIVSGAVLSIWRRRCSRCRSHGGSVVVVIAVVVAKAGVVASIA